MFFRVSEPSLIKYVLCISIHGGSYTTRFVFFYDIVIIFQLIESICVRNIILNIKTPKEKGEMWCGYCSLYFNCIFYLNFYLKRNSLKNIVLNTKIQIFLKNKIEYRNSSWIMHLNNLWKVINLYLWDRIKNI